MTVEQLERARELNIKIVSIKGVITDLEAITSSLRILEHDCDCKTATMRIEAMGEYENVPPIRLMNIIHFLEEQKTKYEEEVERLSKEFSKL